MSASRWRGLSALVRDAVVHASQAIETLQRETVRRPVALLARVAPASPAVPLARSIAMIHAAALAVSHGSIRGVTVLVDRLVEVGSGTPRRSARRRA